MTYTDADVARLVEAVEAARTMAAVPADEGTLTRTEVECLYEHLDEALATFLPKRVGVREAADAVYGSANASPRSPRSDERIVSLDALEALRQALADEPDWKEWVGNMLFVLDAPGVSERVGGHRELIEGVRRLLEEWP